MIELKTLIEEAIATINGDALETEWSKEVPKKIDILIWKVRLGRIPTREYLDKIGIDLHSVLCPRCLKEVGPINHALCLCEEVRKFWQEVARWWSVNLESIDSIDSLLEAGNNREGNAHKSKL